MLQFIENGMNQPFLVIDAFLQGDHGFGATYPLNIVYAKDDILGMCSVLCPYFAEDIEFSSGYMGYGYIGNFGEPFQYKFGLMRLLKEDPHISDKGIPKFYIVQGK